MLNLLLVLFFISESKIIEIITKLSNEVETKAFHTQQAILKSVHFTLCPEAQAAGKKHNLLEIYGDLCVSPKYHGHADRIALFLVEKLSLSSDGCDQEELKKHIHVLTNDDIVKSRELQFVDFLIYLSYESKETLVKANILPESANKSKKDEAELISESVQSGWLALNNLKEWLKRCAADNYKSKIEEILRCREWTTTADRSLKLKTDSFSPSKSGDCGVEKDSPRIPQHAREWQFNKEQLHDKNWTAPIGKLHDPTSQLKSK